jgi:hypothetical protein
VALGSIFPEQCSAWSVATKNVRETFREDLAERQNKARQDLVRQEPSLQHALRDAVVEHVMKLFT